MERGVRGSLNPEGIVCAEGEPGGRSVTVWCVGDGFR
jgi:hypothetical protein